MSSYDKLLTRVLWVDGLEYHAHIAVIFVKTNSAGQVILLKLKDTNPTGEKYGC